jgi:hypothetical protein
LKYFKKIKDRIIKFIHKKQIDSMWEDNSQTKKNLNTMKVEDLFLNIEWVNNNGTYIPCYFYKLDDKNIPLYSYYDYKMIIENKEWRIPVINKILTVKH